MRACMHARVRACARVHACVRVHTRTRAHAPEHVPHVHISVCSYALSCTCECLEIVGLPSVASAPRESRSHNTAHSKMCKHKHARRHARAHLSVRAPVYIHPTWRGGVPSYLAAAVMTIVQHRQQPARCSSLHLSCVCGLCMHARMQTCPCAEVSLRMPAYMLVRVPALRVQARLHACVRAHACRCVCTRTWAQFRAHHSVNIDSVTASNCSRNVGSSTTPRESRAGMTSGSTRSRASFFISFCEGSELRTAKVFSSCIESTVSVGYPSSLRVACKMAPIAAHEPLCFLWCARWQSVVQYHATLHRLHRNAAGLAQ